MIIRFSTLRSEMRSLGLIALLTFFSQALAQPSDSLFRRHEVNMGYVDTLPTSFYITCGGMVASDSRGMFVRFMFDQTTAYPSGESTVSFTAKNTIGAVQFDVGAEFASHNRVWMHHRFEAQYFHLAGSFSYDFTEGQTQYFKSMYDHVNATYVQDAAVLSYKFEPSARRFYGSLGINAIIGSVVIDEQIDRTTTDFLGKTSYNTINKRTWCHPNNYPLSIGGGMIFRTPKLIVKPGIYVMPCLNNGFYYYMASVSVGWRMYQLTSY